MAGQNRPEDVFSVLQRMERAGENGRVSVANLVEEIGAGAFGPLLLVPALILVTPASGIPGLPTVGSLIISLIAVQIVVGRKSLWLPAFLRNRAMDKQRLEKAISYLHRPARFIDRIARERLTFLTERPFLMVPALICSLMVLFSPAFETVPFSVSIVASGISLFALAMVTRDGLLMLLGLALVVGAAYLSWAVLS